MKKYGIYAFAAGLVLVLSVPLFAQNEVNDNTVIRVLQASYPKLETEQVEIELIKNLNNRVKVNLKLVNTPAILYLTWQRYRNQYRWWYERNERDSLVFLGKRPQQLSRLATVSRPQAEPEMQKPAVQEEQAEEPRTEIIEFGEKTEKKEPEKKVAEPKREIPKVEPEKQVMEEKAEEQPEEVPAEKPAEEKKPAPPVEKPEEQPVEMKEEPKKAEAEEVKAAETKEKSAAEKAESKPTEEPQSKEQPKTPEAKPEPKEKPAEVAKPMAKEEPVQKAEPVKEAESTKEELQEELNKRMPSAKETPPEQKESMPAEKMPTKTPAPEPMKMEEPVASDAQPDEAAEAQGEAGPFLPVPIATGPAATPREFLSTLVMTVGKGEDEQYANFLFRPSEMAGEVQERNFERAMNIWIDQFDVVHEQLKNAGHITILRVLLQRPQTPELERTTLESLKRQLNSVLSVYNYVKIELAIDGQPAYITIGGLVQTEGGWRIAGRIDLIKQIGVQ